MADFLQEAGILQVVTSILLAENDQVVSDLTEDHDRVAKDLPEKHDQVASILREENDKVISILPADHDRVTNFLKVRRNSQRIAHALQNTKNRFKILQSLDSHSLLARHII